MGSNVDKPDEGIAFSMFSPRGDSYMTILAAVGPYRKDSPPIQTSCGSSPAFG